MRKKFSDPRGQHIRLYADIYDSPAWQALDHADHEVWVAMRRSLGSTNNGDISATLSTMKHRGIKSSSTLAKGLRHLRSVGLIAITRPGGVRQGSKKPTLYRFTDVETAEFPKLAIENSKRTAIGQARGQVDPRFAK